MRRVAALVLAAAVLAGCASANADPATGPIRKGPIDFHEGFDGPLDHSRWTTCYWWAQSGCTNLANDEAQWYEAGQASTAHGVLQLTARPSASTHLERRFTWASGMVTTGRSGNGLDDAARYAFTYGVVEVRFRAPAGAGLWPAIWMLPVTNRSLPEIDLMEQYGSKPSEASMTLHAAGAGKAAKVDRRTVTVGDLSVGWHTIALEWTPGHLRWALDGRTTYEVSGRRVPHEPMYLLADLAVGGHAGPRSASHGAAAFLIDDVKVWTLP
jgi:beta-glucanase (GH16 family)